MVTFTPTAEWQDIPDGAVLPPGCVIKMNLETGRKQARLDVPPPTNGPDQTFDFDDAYQRGETEPLAEVKRLAEYFRNQFLHWPSLAGHKAPPRQFIIPDWIPAFCVTLLHGFGGVGKSLLAQQIGTAAAFKRELLGTIADACPVLAWWGEDDDNEIWRRQENINAALGLDSIANLESKLFWCPCPGDDITLFTAANEFDFRSTPAFQVLREQVLDLKIKLAILDSAAQIAAIPRS